MRRIKSNGNQRIGLVFIFSIVLIAILTHFNRYIQTFECQLSKLIQPMCTVLYCLWIIGMLNPKHRPVQSAVQGEYPPELRRCYKDDSDETETVIKQLSPSLFDGKAQVQRKIWRVFVNYGLIDWLIKVLRPARHKIGHLGNVFPSQSLLIVPKKLNRTQQNQTTEEQNSLS